LIKYLGSKRLLLEEIVSAAGAVEGATTAVDLFSGTARVGHALKRAGFRVLANDYAAYAHMLATCYVQADAEEWAHPAAALLRELQETPPAPGYLTRVFCEEARFFTPENGATIDAIREEIEARRLPPELRAIALVSLMEAADRVDSTTGVQMAYLKQWAPRARNPLTLRLPSLLPAAEGGKGLAVQMDAREAARTLRGDIAYLDPPYNQHSYLANYHVWETLVRWDAPEAYGVARKRADTRERKSPFNSRPGHAAAMREVIENLDAGVLIVSFSNEGYLTLEELRDLLAARGSVLVLEYDFRRYVGAQIGIHNPHGEKVGRVSHLRNKERILIAASPAQLRRIRQVVQGKPLA